MKISLKSSLKELKAEVLGTYGLSDIPNWICSNTKINGNRFSFVGHEYQERILQSTAPEIVIKKCSQVGISELVVRRNLALMDIINGFKVIHTLPTASFAQSFMKTRIDPVINSSPRLRSNLNIGLDNASIKQIRDSFLYLKGTIGDNTSISVPADLIAVDELDFSDQENVEKMQSRLTASDYKWWFYLSTPTIPNFGIDAKFAGTRRFFNYCKCCHCNQWFIPDYLKHVVIPDYAGDILAINKQALARIPYQEAKLLCPNCGKEPLLIPEHREWVCENPMDNLDAEGFFINPFDSTKITPAYLIIASTRFKRKVNFVNYHLGQVMEDKDSGFQDADIDRMLSVGQVSLRGFKVMGIDMGVECHVIVGVTDGEGNLRIIVKKRVHYTSLDIELDKLVAEHKPTTIVMDSQPYVETVYRLQRKYPNLYGAVYITTKNLETFKMIDKEEDRQKSLLDVRQVNVNRNFALDALMDDIRSSRVGVMGNDEDFELFSTQLKDMKRKPKETGKGFVDPSNANEEPDSYVWVKTTGNDHYHHALLYTHVAAQLVHHLPSSGSGMGLYISSFKSKL